MGEGVVTNPGIPDAPWDSVGTRFEAIHSNLFRSIPPDAESFVRRSSSKSQGDTETHYKEPLMHRRSFVTVGALAATLTCCRLFSDEASNAKTGATSAQEPTATGRTVPVVHALAADGVKCACILFDGNKGNQTIFEGRIARAPFVKWFKEDYHVGGERMETPHDATVIGALVLADDDEILVMPMHTWRIRSVRSFSCQSIAIGKAPMFSVMEESKERFIATMKVRLTELSAPTT